MTTDFGQAEQILQDQIDKNRARVRVAADMSGEGLEKSRPKSPSRRPWPRSPAGIRGAQGLATPETTKATQSTKELGPAAKTLAPIPEI